jgi:hypothetical protein
VDEFTTLGCFVRTTMTVDFVVGALGTVVVLSCDPAVALPTTNIAAKAPARIATAIPIFSDAGRRSLTSFSRCRA